MMIVNLIRLKKLLPNNRLQNENAYWMMMQSFLMNWMTMQNWNLSLKMMRSSLMN